MTKEKQEHLILQIKYAFLALIVGICVGIVDTVFGRGLLAISAFRTAHYQFLLPFLPLTGLLIIWLYQHFSSLSLKGMSLILKQDRKKRRNSTGACSISYNLHMDHTSFWRQCRPRRCCRTDWCYNFTRSRTQTSYKRKDTSHAYHRYGCRIRWIIPDSSGGCIFCYGSDCCRIYGV